MSTFLSIFYIILHIKINKYHRYHLLPKDQVAKYICEYFPSFDLWTYVNFKLMVWGSSLLGVLYNDSTYFFFNFSASARYHKFRIEKSGFAALIPKLLNILQKSNRYSRFHLKSKFFLSSIFSQVLSKVLDISKKFWDFSKMFENIYATSKINTRLVRIFETNYLLGVVQAYIFTFMQLKYLKLKFVYFVKSRLNESSWSLEMCLFCWNKLLNLNIWI